MRPLFFLLAAGHTLAQLVDTSTPADVTATPTTIPTSTPLVDATTATDETTTTPTDSLSAPVDSFISSGTPTDTAVLAAATEFTIVDVTEGEATPDPDADKPRLDTTPAQHLLELEANKGPEGPISPENARAVAILETGLFEHFAVNAPAPVDAAYLTIPDNITNCTPQNKRRSLLSTERIGSLLRPRVIGPLDSEFHAAGNEKRSLVPIDDPDNCEWTERLDIPVYFRYVQPEYKHNEISKGALMTRIKDQLAFANKEYNPLGIYFSLGGLKVYDPVEKGTKEQMDWYVLTKNEAKLLRWQKATRVDSKRALTVWLVYGLRSPDAKPEDTTQLLGYGTFPDGENKDWTKDGIVMLQDLIWKNGGTFIHEVGHWLGLRHVFYTIVDKKADDCKKGDGLLDTTHFPGFIDEVFNCRQVPCKSKDKKEVPNLNWMSYSDCQGDVPGHGFTTDQKARMFAYFVHYRKGYASMECKPKALIKKRSSMQDLLDGKCPDIDKQIEIIQSTPIQEDKEDGASMRSASMAVIAGAVGVMAWML
ncbi:hypothetical protein OQA88_2500 [Cercophora sp. LCS_1]